MRPFTIVQHVIFTIIFILFLLGLYGYFFRHETNYCEMTYMYENPTYPPIAMSSVIEKSYPRYSLHSYCEGVRCEAHRQGQFEGHPVLFIVGNADSYRQVRSLGSVAYRMNDEKKKRLDYFSIDFNEELSALFGGVLDQQTEFVAHSIRTILSLYKSKRTIILVGNSIGGLLSRAIFIKSIDPSLVRLIITQATPHQAPVIHSDSYVLDFYHRVNEHWRTEWNQTLKHLVVLSLAGGDRDHLVRSDLCSLKGLTDPSRSIDILTSAVPNVWSSTDHRCIVWCRQLVLTTTRALIDIVQNKEPIIETLKRYFQPSIDLQSASNSSLVLNKEPIVVTQSRITLTRQESTDYSIPIQSSTYRKIILHSTNARIFLQTKTNLKEITSTLIPLPPSYSERKSIEFHLQPLDSALNKVQSIVIRLDHSKAQVDVFQIDQDEKTVDLPIFTSQTFNFQKIGYVKLNFPTLTHLWQVYTIRLVSNKDQVPLMHFHVPWSNEDLYNLVTLRNPSSPSTVLLKSLHRQMRLKLHRPASKNEQSKDSPSLELFLDPQISYTLHIDLSFVDVLAQLVRYHVFLLPTFLFTVLCVSFTLQIYDVRLRVYQTMFAWQVHLPFAVLLTVLYRLLILLCPRSNFVVNLSDNSYYFLLLPMVLYAVALTLWTFIAFIVDYMIFDFIRRFLYPIFIQFHAELSQQTKYTRLVQTILLGSPLIYALIFSGSSAHIALFFLAIGHTLWRGTINIRLREILTTLLFFHGLLVLLNLTGFIIHVRSVFVQSFAPLVMIMPDPSFVSAICSIVAFSFRFIFDRTKITLIGKLRILAHRYARVICMGAAVLSQVYCSYSMSYLWIGICVIFVQATLLFFVPVHQE